MILANWYDRLEERFSFKEVQFKKVCSPVKTRCPVAENINETPEIIIARIYQITMQSAGQSAGRNEIHCNCIDHLKFQVDS